MGNNHSGMWSKKLQLPPPAKVKLCSRCGKSKPRDEFYKHALSIDGLAYWCRQCFREYDLGKAPPKTPLLLTSAELEGRMQAQGGRCAICSVDITGTHKGRRKAHIDHCHNTGSVRALLCNRCNVTVGYIEKSPVPFTKYFDYINKHREVNDDSIEEVE